jgi:hypothetical protein
MKTLAISPHIIFKYGPRCRILNALKCTASSILDTVKDNKSAAEFDPHRGLYFCKKMLDGCRITS